MKLVNSLIFLKAIIFQMSFFYLPSYLKDLGLSGWEIGILFGIFNITGLVLILPMGIMNDRLISKKLLAISFIMYGFAYLMIGKTEAFIMLIPIIFFIGLANILSRTSFDAIILKTIKNKEKELAVNMFYRTFGSALGFLVSGFILVKYEFSIIFLISAIVFLVLTVLSFRLPVTTTEIIPITEYKKSFLRKDVLVFAAVLFIFNIHFGAEQTSYTLFLKENLGLDWIGIGAYMGISVAILALTCLYVGKRLSNNSDFTNIMMLGLALSGIGHILMINPSFGISLFWRCIHEIGDAFILVIGLYGVSCLFKKKEIGGENALFGLVTIISAFLSSLIFGPMGETYGYHIPIIISGFAALLAIPVLYRFKRLLANVNGKTYKKTKASRTE